MTTVTAAPIWQRNVHGLRDLEAPILTGEKPAYASSCPDVTAYWNACQCFGITPTLVTEIAPTPTVVLDGPTCTQGLEFALYAPKAGSPAFQNLDFARVNGLSNLDLKLLLGGQTPDVTGVSPSIAVISGDNEAPIQVYGITGPDGTTLSKSIIDHRGFIVPEVEGTYTVTVSDSNDATFFWSHEAAVSGFDQANAEITKGYNDGPPKSFSFVVTAEEVQQPVPVRLLWINWAGRGVLDVKVVDPAGKTILGHGTVKNKQVLAGCSGNFAPVPVWEEWEAETVGAAPVSE